MNAASAEIATTEGKSDENPASHHPREPGSELILSTLEFMGVSAYDPLVISALSEYARRKASIT